MPQPIQLLKLSLLLAGCAALFSGCATSAPKAKFSQSLATRVTARDAAKVAVSTAGDAKMLEYERSRLAEVIHDKIKAKQAANAGTAKGKSYAVEVTVTRYDKGNAFARSMLMGLGQIHIDATVMLYATPERTKLGEFVLRKTFAWGGLYGGFTSMEDVEKGFAEGVAAALTGQAEEPPKPAPSETKPPAGVAANELPTAPEIGRR